MKKTLVVTAAAVVALSFAMPVMAEGTKEEKPAAEKVKEDSKDVKKDKKKKKAASSKGGEAKPAAKGKKEVSGC